MAFVEDLDEFLDVDHGFAVTATWSPSTSTTQVVTCIFDAEYVDPLGVESAAPVAVCKTADVATAKHGQAFVLGATQYKIRGVQPDGTGITLLKLERA